MDDPTEDTQEVQNAKATLRELVMTLGMSFHPDNPISDYVALGPDLEIVGPTFHPTDTDRLQAGLDSAFQVLGVDGLYEFVKTLEPWKSYFEQMEGQDNS